MNIGPEDLVDENLRIILGLIWSLILRYQIKADKGDGGARSELLEWVRSKVFQESNFL